MVVILSTCFHVLKQRPGGTAGSCLRIWRVNLVPYGFRRRRKSKMMEFRSTKMKQIRAHHLLMLLFNNNRGSLWLAAVRGRIAAITALMFVADGTPLQGNNPCLRPKNGAWHFVSRHAATVVAAQSWPLRSSATDPATAGCVNSPSGNPGPTGALCPVALKTDQSPRLVHAALHSGTGAARCGKS